MKKCKGAKPKKKKKEKRNLSETEERTRLSKKSIDGWCERAI